MPWDIKPNVPVYIQLIEHLKSDIISGKYNPGDKLLSVRELASEAAVNPNTVQRALSELERDGLIVTQRTNGKFITEDISLINALKDNHAKQLIDDFIIKMIGIGYTPAEIPELVIRYMTQEYTQKV